MSAVTSVAQSTFDAVTGRAARKQASRAQEQARREKARIERLAAKAKKETQELIREAKKKDKRREKRQSAVAKELTEGAKPRNRKGHSSSILGGYRGSEEDVSRGTLLGS